MLVPGFLCWTKCFGPSLPGILVPRATKIMAVTESLMPSVQPKWDATSPMMAVTTPMQKMDTTKQRYPPDMSGIK